VTEGTRLLAGRYQVGALIGRGGMSDVHVGTDSRLGRRVAIKLLKPSLATDPKFRVLFREEAQKAARMAHPTIVRVFDAGEETVTGENGLETQVPYIVMEYVDGRVLRDIIAEGPVDPKEAVHIVSGILTALEYSHRALLVHRDIKPANVMVTANGQVKVMDFGIARAVSDNAATVADASTLIGTAQYFSPEQARGEAVDARTDLYSTGVVLFELLTGRPPFRGERAAAVAYQHISEVPVAPSTLNPHVSPALDAVVLRALSKDKFERFQTAAEFRADLEAAGSGEVPTRRLPAGNDFNATLFGVNPNATAGSEAALRQLQAPDDERAVRTQNRPPVAWIWVGILTIAVIIVAVSFWVINLPPTTLGDDLSVKIPNLAGKSYDEAQKILTGDGLQPSKAQENSATIANGAVVRTTPTEGTRVGKGQAVTVFVSMGKEAVIVPSVSNMAEADAVAAIKAHELVYGQSTPAHSPSVAKGVVISSKPDGGSSARKGDSIDLVVSDGLISIPSVVGQDIAAANTTLGALQLNINPVQDTSCSGGKVTSQSLTGDNQPQRSSITIHYCAASGG
jgi:serine/threonine protein kinase